MRLSAKIATAAFRASVGAALGLLGSGTAAFAQIARHPFAIGANEGSVGHQNALGAWIIGQESAFYRMLNAALHATKDNPRAGLGLIAVSLAYGVFHAAGPGHGKAVVASYMISNEVALRRGLAISALAALMQAVVAVVVISILGALLHVTAQRLTAATEVLEFASYLAIIALGLALVWRKGRALLANLRPAPSGSLLLASAGTATLFDDAPFAGGVSSRFVADDGSAHVHDPACGHLHMPDAAALSAPGFNWRAAAVTVMTAGARPCSGALAVLIFALSQGIYLAGIVSAFAMAIGTAATTGMLAIAAVYAKDFAVRLAEGRSTRGRLIGNVVELAAAACVLAFGIALMLASLSGVHIDG